MTATRGTDIEGSEDGAGDAIVETGTDVGIGSAKSAFVDFGSGSAKLSLSRLPGKHIREIYKEDVTRQRVRF